MTTFPRRQASRKRGQTLVEYALIISLIVVVAVSVMISLGGTLRGFFSTANSQIQAAESSH